ncbi:MAG: hypothetical protein PHQ91_04575 [Thermoanaerobaculaceae bacterium]|nr:hypothetical protein [Thermoanaerobaculaceae bacterium]
MRERRVSARVVVSLVVTFALVLAASAWAQTAKVKDVEQLNIQPVPCRVVEAPLRALPPRYAGKCPVTIKFEGAIKVAGRIGPNNPCVVDYVFDRSDGGIDTVAKTLTFTAPGSKPVATTWQLGGPELPHFAGWEAVRTTSPGAPRQWAHANFEILCRETKQPEAKIVSIACAGGLAVKVHILIDSPAGIASYSVWSVFTGNTNAEKSFSAPLPTHIDEVVDVAHTTVDPVDRAHQWGLKVVVPGMAQPILTYGMEPGPQQRCPGHYEPAPALQRPKS